jgi:hypothetical protein
MQLSYIVNDMDEKVDLIKRIKSFSHFSKIPILLLVTVDIETDLRNTLNQYKVFSSYTPSIF